jgi:hypothetical protein
MQTEAEPTPLSQELIALARSATTVRISVQDLLDGIQTHARATLLVLFALPNTLPGIPGTSAITGLPLVFLTAQMMLGSKVWLPGIIANRSMPSASLLTVFQRAEPWLAKVERVLEPRLLILSNPRMAQVIGGLCLLLSILVMLPVPFGNMLPALAIILISLGFLERDGRFIIAGLVTAAAAVTVVITIYWSLIAAALFMTGG